MQMNQAPSAPKNFWQGEKVRLRLLHREDWKTIHEESSDSEGIRVFESSIQLPQSAEMLQVWIADRVERMIRREDGGSMSFVIESVDGEMVGISNLHGMNQQSGTFSFAVRIYRPHQRLGYARDAVRILLRYAFWELRFQKANSTTMEGNEPSIRLHQELGFQTEGRVRRNVFTDGRFHDEILFGLTREEFDDMEKTAALPVEGKNNGEI